MGSGAADETTCSTAGSDSAPLRILLAEDEAVNRLAAAAMLRRAGHAVVTAEDGPAAVAAAHGERFDLILMDLGLPGFDGDEAVRRIRSHPAVGRKVPILMLTATATPAGLKRCEGCGADGVLSKPLRLDALEAALRGALPADAAGNAGQPDTIDPAAIAQMRALLPAGRAAELVAKTASTLRQYRADLTGAWAAGDRKAAAALAHKVAGVAGQYGCVALRRAAHALEAALEGGDLREAGRTDSDAFAALDLAYGPALAHLDANTAVS